MKIKLTSGKAPMFENTQIIERQTEKKVKKIKNLINVLFVKLKIWKVSKQNIPKKSQKYCEIKITRKLQLVSMQFPVLWLRRCKRQSLKVAKLDEFNEHTCSLCMYCSTLYCAEWVFHFLKFLLVFKDFFIQIIEFNLISKKKKR